MRYGTIGSGEKLIASDPPAGVLDATIHDNFDRFAVTFDTPNYVYINDIEVQVTSSVAPQVKATRRRELNDPDPTATVEIVLDQPLAIGQTVRFIFHDGDLAQTIEYTLVLPDTDSDGDGIPDLTDNCPFHANTGQADCDNDNIGDVCTIADCMGDPACSDCNSNTLPDSCDLNPLGLDLLLHSEPRTSVRADSLVSWRIQHADNRYPITESALGSSADCNGNGIPDECEADCNSNSIPDDCDVLAGAPDCDRNLVLDECQADSDGDGVIDACDPCPDELINDQDGDGVCFPEDQCPTDASKTIVGLCGCGVSEIDTDGDTVPDCNDQCPNEDNRIDENNNGTPDCAEKPTDIPTLSAWGVVIIILALLIISKILAGRISAKVSTRKGIDA